MTTNQASRLLIYFAICLGVSASAFGQSTFIISPTERVTCGEVSVGSYACNHEEGPADHRSILDRHYDNKAREQWCKMVGLPTKGGQTPCGLSWQDFKDNLTTDFETHHACQDKFGASACKTVAVK